MSAINTLIVEAKNKLDEIQEAVERRPKPGPNAAAAEFVYGKWEPVARKETGQGLNLDSWIEGLVDNTRRLRELEAAKATPTARKVLDKLSDVRKEVLVILGAKKGEGTRVAARRVMRQLTRALQRITELEDAGLSEMTALKNLRLSRTEALKILGGKRGEGLRAAARRVVASHPWHPATDDLATAVSIYNELDEEAQRAGHAKGSVRFYVTSLKTKQAKK